MKTSACAKCGRVVALRKTSLLAPENTPVYHWCHERQDGERGRTFDCAAGGCHTPDGASKHTPGVSIMKATGEIVVEYCDACGEPWPCSTVWADLGA